MAIERTRIQLLVGAAATGFLLAVPGTGAAQPPTITVYKNPT